MAKYHVQIISTLSATVEVEAASPEEAVDSYWKAEGMPGSMAHGAFGEASVDESGDWVAVSVEDEEGETVWTDDAS